MASMKSSREQGSLYILASVLIVTLVAVIGVAAFNFSRFGHELPDFYHVIGISSGAGV
jgi:hypothetical protein